MRSGAAIGLTVLLVLGALAGCGASTGGPATTSTRQPSATSSSAKASASPSTSGAAPAAAATSEPPPPGRSVGVAAGRALRAANSGTIVQTTTTTYQDATVTRTTRTRYDLRQKAWATTNEFTADPPSLMDDPAAGKGYETLAVGGSLYLTMPGWPEKLRGRWMRMDEAFTDGGTGTVPSYDPIPVRALEELSGGRLERSGDGSSTVTGRVGIATVIDLLGLQPKLVKADVDPADLVGSAQVRLEIDRSGRPTRLLLRGTDVIPGPGVPQDVRDVIELQTVEVRFTGFAEDESFTAPNADQIIDPSEMDGGDPTGANPST